MTTILGIRQNGVTYLAADTRANGGNAIVPSTMAKIIPAGPWLIGFSGPRRFMNLARELSAELSERQTIDTLTHALKGLVERDGFKPTGNPGTPDFECFGLVVAHANGLYHIGSDFGWCEIDEGRPWGQGSGSEWAEGACAALLLSATAPISEILREAIRIASEYDASTGGRIDVVTAGKTRSDCPAMAFAEGYLRRLQAKKA